VYLSVTETQDAITALLKNGFIERCGANASRRSLDEVESREDKRREEEEAVHTEANYDAGTALEFINRKLRGAA
jgi:hypothetical protein